jgi:N,N-dimethylformamidase
MSIVSYSDPLTVRAGQQIEFKVSTTAASYEADFVRIILGDENPAGPGPKLPPVPVPGFPATFPGADLPVPSGSHLRVPGEPSSSFPDGFSVTCWMFPTAPGGADQTIVHSETAGGSWALTIDGSSRLTFTGAGATLRHESPLRPHTWYLVVVGHDGRRTARLVALPLRPTIGDEPQLLDVDVNAPLRVGALTFAGRPVDDIVASACFDGKLDTPTLWPGLLSREDIARVHRDELPTLPAHRWDLASSPANSAVPDLVAGWHGQLLHQPTRAVTSHSWSGHIHEWSLAPDQYAAIHFHATDRDDARWPTAIAFTVPDGWTSAIYGLRLVADDGTDDLLPFFVRPAAGAPTEDVAFLVPTLSYLAYGNQQVTGRLLDDPIVKGIFGEGLLDYPRAPEDVFIVSTGLRSTYDHHSDGSGVMTVSRRLPIADMRARYRGPVFGNLQGAPHQFGADLHLVDWLHQKGYAHDVLTDEDLHHDGDAALAPYRVLLTGTHPEYWTESMLDTLEHWLERGGRLMYLGGNGFYWVTSIYPSRPHLVEVRKWAGNRAYDTPAGERHHASTGELGGLWRGRGRTPQRLTGVGFTAQGFDVNAPYRRTKASYEPRFAPLLRGIDGDTIGDVANLVQSHGAAGVEIDRADPALGTPPASVVLASSFGHSDSYQHAVEEIYVTDQLQGGTLNPLVRADLTVVPYPNGGAVFSTGSIAWSGALAADGYDNDVSQLTANVLDQFLTADDLFQDPEAR